MQKKIWGNNKGFSLMELIVAVLIIAIISGGSMIALGSLFSNKMTAAAKSVQDGLKQARVDGLGMKNEYDSSTQRTGIYAKFYKSGSELYVDVCVKNGSSTAEVLHTRKIADDTYGLELWKNGAATSIATVGASDIYVYFKKSTGAISSIYKVNAGDDVSSGEDVDANILRVVGPGTDHQDVIMVTVTGRCYID